MLSMHNKYKFITSNICILNNRIFQKAAIAFFARATDPLFPTTGIGDALGCLDRLIFVIQIYKTFLTKKCDSEYNKYSQKCERQSVHENANTLGDATPRVFFLLTSCRSYRQATCKYSSQLHLLRRIEKMRKLRS